MNLANHQTDVSRFCDIAEGPERMTLPMEGYEKVPLVTLEQAIEPLLSYVSDLKRMVWVVKQRCTNPADSLSPDESASIMLYTMSWPPNKKSFYMILNDVLRHENDVLLKNWFLYLKLFVTALSKIPSERRFLHRGVKKNLSADYSPDSTKVWWAFSSCTSSVKTLESDLFLGKTGTRTLFTIDCYSGKDIYRHSMHSKEDEVLLLAASRFKVLSQLDAGNGLTVIQIKEIDPAYHFSESLSTNNTSASTISSSIISSKRTHGNGPYHNEKLEQTIKKMQSRKLDLSQEQLNDQDMEIVVNQGLIDKECIKLINIQLSA
ncbi:unnamed protein product [Rotaria sp. Silwood1]|nr:unnamed protein product [Rotaria sp. Silwood1]